MTHIAANDKQHPRFLLRRKSLKALETQFKLALMISGTKATCAWLRVPINLGFYHDDVGIDCHRGCTHRRSCPWSCSHPQETGTTGEWRQSWAQAPCLIEPALISGSMPHRADSDLINSIPVCGWPQMSPQHVYMGSRTREMRRVQQPHHQLHVSQHAMAPVPLLLLTPLLTNRPGEGHDGMEGTAG